jgi:histidinol-phosphatase
VSDPLPPLPPFAPDLATRRELLVFAGEMADEADAITLPAFLGSPIATAKADGTPVTEADTGAEELIRDRIRHRYPTHAILGEELGEIAGTTGGAGIRWIIDPIDGTVSFARGIQVWATLIAVEADGELLASVVSAPALRQRWSAVRGGGATTNRGEADIPIHVSSVDRLEDAHLVYSSLGVVAAEGRDGLLAALRRSQRDRGIGDFWGYMCVAQGSADAMFEVGIKPWDLAAPALVVTEAGGRFTDLDGVPTRAGPSGLATNGHLHDELLELLRRR